MVFRRHCGKARPCSGPPNGITSGRVGGWASGAAPEHHGLVVGDGAFETLKTSGGRAFAVTRHLARLRRTLDALAIGMPGQSTVPAKTNYETLAHELSGSLLAQLNTFARERNGTLFMAMLTAYQALFDAAKLFRVSLSIPYLSIRPYLI